MSDVVTNSFTPDQSMLAAISHLRSACNEVVKGVPCAAPNDPTCHCPTCIVQHALSATSGYADRYCFHCQIETATHEEDCIICGFSKQHKETPDATVQRD